MDGFLELFLNQLRAPEHGPQALPAGFKKSP
jgi:hypothetical protein